MELKFVVVFIQSGLRREDAAPTNCWTRRFKGIGNWVTVSIMPLDYM